MAMYLGSQRVCPVITVEKGINNQNKTINENGTYSADSGYTGLGTVTVNVPTSEPEITTLTITPTTTSQTITAPSGTDGYNPVNVSAVTANIDSNIKATNIKKDVTILGVTGTLETGIIPTGTLSITENGTYNVTNYANADVNITKIGKYQLLQRIKDDSNNEIGTVSGFFTDGNDVEYAVVCLDATYRDSSVAYASNNTTSTPLPLYTNQSVYGESKTATENTTGILSAVSSEACSHCRNNSFTINGTLYYGQLPNIIELIDIFKHRTAINNADTSGGSIVIPTSTVTWSSTAYSVSSAWAINASGHVLNTKSRASSYLCIPVLEIPNN